MREPHHRWEKVRRGDAWGHPTVVWTCKRCGLTYENRTDRPPTVADLEGEEDLINRDLSCDTIIAEDVMGS